MDREHCFLRRNACLLSACNDNSNDNDQTLCELFNIKSSVLADSPVWLQKWAKNILEFVQQEEQLFIEE